MSLGWAFDCWVDFGPNEVRGDVAGTVVLLYDPWPEVNDKVLIIHLKRKDVFQFIFVQFFSQLLLLFILSQLNLSQIFMFQLLLVRVVEFLFDSIHIYFFFLFTAIVIFDHHHSLPFVVPWGLGVFTDDHVIRSYEEGLGEGAVDHHDVWLDCEEAGVVFLGEVEQTVEFFDALLELVLQLVDVFLFLLELLVVDVLLELDTLELFVDFLLFLDLFCWFMGLESLRDLDFIILGGLDYLLFCCVQLFKRLFIHFIRLFGFLRILHFQFLCLLFSLPLFLFFLNSFLLFLQLRLDIICQFFIISLDLMREHWRCGQENAVQTDSRIKVVTAAPHPLKLFLEFPLIKWESNLEKHLNREKSQHCAGGLSCARTPDN